MLINILSDQPVSPNLASKNSSLACAYPLSTWLSDRSIACVYRQGAGKHSHDGILVMQTSQDHGVTWEAPQTIFDGRSLEPRQTAEIGGPCQIPDGRVLVTLSTVEGLPEDVYMFSEEGEKLPRRLWSTLGQANGQGWESPAEIELSRLNQAGITAKPFVLSGGEICLPIEYKSAAGVLGTAMAFSRNGESFGPLVVVAEDAASRLNWCDARFEQLPDGRLIALMWTFLQENERTVEVHQTFSSDGGHSWTHPQGAGFVGQITAPLALAGGRLIAASNYRHPPEGIRLWASLDTKGRWDLEHPVQMWDAASGRMLAKPPDGQSNHAGDDGVWEALASFTFGTPDLLALDDGTLLLTYYATLGEVIHVRACRFRIDWRK